MSSANKIEEAQFEHVCMYCGKLNLLEKHREVFFGLRDCIDDSVKENVKIKKENEYLKNKTPRLPLTKELLRNELGNWNKPLLKVQLFLQRNHLWRLLNWKHFEPR